VVEGGEDSSARFGRLRPVAAASVEGWSHEAHDFTPWLAEHLDLLGEQVGLALRLREREFPVGRYSLDLLLEDGQGRTVIVENQFGQTDHDHLGKLLTYCAGAEADVVIWISETLTEEHVGALEWLNENTVAGVGFFGVELELLKIDGSRPAPHFRVAVQPNEWKKRVRPEPEGPQEWDWAAYGESLGIGQDRLAVGRALVEGVEAEVRGRGLPWETVFRKGFVAFQRPGGYNAMLVDMYWRKAPRLAVKIPAPLEEVGRMDPYPGLESSWNEPEKEWGWTVPTLDAMPDTGAAVELARAFQPDSGRMPPWGG
jgi:hypothetical protein